MTDQCTCGRGKYYSDPRCLECDDNVDHHNDDIWVGGVIGGVIGSVIGAILTAVCFWIFT